MTQKQAETRVIARLKRYGLDEDDLRRWANSSQKETKRPDKKRALNQSLAGELIRFFQFSEVGAKSPLHEPTAGAVATEPVPPEWPPGADHWEIARVTERLKVADRLMPAAPSNPRASVVLRAYYGLAGTVANPAPTDPTKEKRSRSSQRVDYRIHAVYPLTGLLPMRRKGVGDAQAMKDIVMRKRESKGPDRKLWDQCDQVARELLEEAEAAYVGASLVVKGPRRPWGGALGERGTK